MSEFKTKVIRLIARNNVSDSPLVKDLVPGVSVGFCTIFFKYFYRFALQQHTEPCKSASCSGTHVQGFRINERSDLYVLVDGFRRFITRRLRRLRLRGVRCRIGRLFGAGGIGGLFGVGRFCASGRFGGIDRFAGIVISLAGRERQRHQKAQQDQNYFFHPLFSPFP